METLGLILLLIGAGSMDSKGIGFYVAAGMIFAGLLLMASGQIKESYKEYKRNNFKEVI